MGHQRATARSGSRSRRLHDRELGDALSAPRECATSPRSTALVDVRWRRRGDADAAAGLAGGNAAKLSGNAGGGSSRASIDKLASMTPAADDLPRLVWKPQSVMPFPRRCEAFSGHHGFTALLRNSRPAWRSLCSRSAVSCHMSRPTPELFAAAQRVLYYLHRHRTLGLRYERSNQERLRCLIAQSGI